MNVLVLSPYPGRIEGTIAGTGDYVRLWNERISTRELAEDSVDFIVSYGYRYLIRNDVIAALPGRIINLHISFLPWNRGSDPNFWSFFDGTPKGVSIHRVDAGLDTGPLLAQEALAFSKDETLASTYEQLRTALEALFARTWPELRAGLRPVRSQEGAGSYHRSRDKEPFFAGLPLGWNSPVGLVEETGRRHRAQRPEMDITETGGR